MICQNCRQDLSAEANFCPSCGHKISNPEPKIQNKHKRPDKSDLFSKPIAAYGALIVTSIIALVIVLLVLNSNKRDYKAEDAQNISSTTQDLIEKSKVIHEKLAQSPNSLQLNIDMGNVQFDLGNFGDAIPYYRKALSIDSGNVSVQIDLEICYFNLQDISTAIQEMNKALTIDPNHQKGLFNIGIMYHNIGEFEKTREYWNRLIDVYPEVMEAKRARELMKNLP
jgi:tetratricopeptide (TPR) repeat protein